MTDSVLIRGLIVSCQAFEGEPLFGSQHMSAMAQAAVEGGAVGIRANGPVDIAAIRVVTTVPLIGLHKVRSAASEVYITPTRASAAAIVTAGCDVVALDATARPRPGNETLAELIAFVHHDLKRPVMADVASLDDALAAEALGADYLGTTLSGYVAGGREAGPGPDLALLAEIVSRCRRPVIAEGRYSTPEHVAQAFGLGAFAVVVGAAITRPQDITRRFVTAVPDAKRASLS